MGLGSRMGIRNIILLVLLTVFSIAGRLAAQTSGGVEGRVLDGSKGAVQGASLLVSETRTRLERTTSSDEAGYFKVLRLPPGIYNIRITAEGFQDQLRKQVAISAGETSRVDFELLPGSPEDVLEVYAEVPLISQSVSGWGGQVSREKLDALPLNGRDLFELASQEIGATIPASMEKKMTNGLGTQISVFGSRPSMNGFQIDGVFINDATGSAPASATGTLLGIESIQEVRIVTSPFSPEYGRTAGALFTAVSRSGSNEFHGSLFDFFRNSALDARNFFDSPGEKIPPLKRNQFGGVLGGPLRRNRLFFLANYEGLRETRGETVRPNVPAAELRQGFLPQQDGSLRQIAIAPQVLPYLKLFPMPNGKEFGNGTAEFVNESVRTAREDFLSVKLDYLLRADRRYSGRYTFDDAISADPDPLRVWTFTQESRYQFAHNQLEWIQSPESIWTFIAALSRIRNGEVSRTQPHVDQSLSFLPGQPLGSIEVTGLATLGGLRARTRPRRYLVNNLQLSTDMVRMRGAHTWKFGLGFNRIKLDQVAQFNSVGVYRFNSIEDFLLARPRQADIMAPGSDSARVWRFHQLFAYLQDEVRLYPNLSLSLGVRYEMASTPREAHGRVATLPDPIHDTQVTLGGPLFENPSLDNFAGRTAMAWDPFGKGRTVVRAGGGIFFDLLGTRELVIAGSRMPPFFRWLVVPRPSFPDVLTNMAATQVPDSIDGLEYYLNQPYTAQWQFGTDHQLTATGVVRLIYAGSRGIHLMGHLKNINPTAPVTLQDGSLYFPPGGPRLNPAFSTMGMRKAAFNSFYHSFSAEWSSRLQKGLAYQVKYTFGKSIDETSRTVFDDFLNSDGIPTMFNFRQNRGPSDFDLRHVFAANLRYTFPRFRFRGATPLSGWTTAVLARAQTGHPFAPYVGFDRAGLLGSGDLGQRPDVSPGWQGRLILGDPAEYFNPLAFELPAVGRYGNLGRGTMTGPGLLLIDWSLQKVLIDQDNWRLRFRAEFFNLPNRPNFQIPSTLGLFNGREERLPTAGRISATATTSRQVQLVLRWEF
jgi:hypothetical protein